jgi:CDP-glycerol glycerophosphotransferase (TagB/SpsB family)
MQRYYRQVGIQFKPEFDDIMRQADVYVCDNSSTLFEFAALERPVVVLNAPWYRRDIELGLRFWKYADIGVQVDSPDDLLDGIAEALNDNPARQARRREIIDELYPFLEHADQHAATQLVEHFRT